jgi:hypothetical protein
MDKPIGFITLLRMDTADTARNRIHNIMKHDTVSLEERE